MPPSIVQVCAVDFTAYHLLRPLMRALRDDGWSVEFACADGPGAEALRREGFRYRPVPITRSLAPLHQLRAVATLALSLRRERPDLVHTHTPVGGVVGRGAAIIAGSSAIVHTFHGLPFRGNSLSSVERAFLVVERVLARRTNRFFSQAANDVARAVALRIARREDTIVIGNGIDLARFRPDHRLRDEVRAELGLPPHAVVALTVARIVREKGLLDLADAVLRLADLEPLHVLVVGAALPSDRTSVEQALDEHPVGGLLGPRWRRLGYREDVHRLMAAADLFVLPTYREGLPRSVIEAMGSGVPVVATTIPACRELIEEDATGRLVDPGDVTALAEAVRNLTRDGEARRRMGERARVVAEARHDERAVLERQVAVLRELLA